RYWIGFRKNPSDKALREGEEALLLKLCSSASDAMSVELLELIYPEHLEPFLEERTKEQQRLREECLKIVFPKATLASISFFSIDGGIRTITERSRYAGVRICLFSPDSPVRNAELRKALLTSIEKGLEDPVAFVNSRELFELMTHSLERRTEVPAD